MATGDLTTIERVKSYLQIDIDEHGPDAELSALITSESARFVSLSGNPILRGTYTSEVRDGDGTTDITPQWVWSTRPLYDVSSVLVDNEIVPERPSAGSDGWFISGSRIILVGYVFTRGTANVEITYVSGYSEAPADVSQAVTEMVGLASKASTRIGIMTESHGGETVSFQTLTLPESVQSVIRAYQPRFSA